MKKYLILSAVSLLVGSKCLASNPNDPGSNDYIQAKSVSVEPHNPPANPSLIVRLSNAPDNNGVLKISNYSLRQTSVPLTSKGGILEDVDGDGDLDMVITNLDKILVYINDGDRRNPRYVNPPHELATVGFFDGKSVVPILDSVINVMFGDVDGDGDRDMICSESKDGQITCFQRANGSSGWPIFGVQKKVLESGPQGLQHIRRSIETGGWITDIGVASIALEDMNNDGVLDLVVGDPFSPNEFSRIPGVLMPYNTQNVFVYRGTGEVQSDGSPVFGEAFPLKAGGALVKLMNVINGVASPAFMDVDGDGDRDLLLATSLGDVWVFRAEGNDGDTASPSYGFRTFSERQLLADIDGQPLKFAGLNALSVVDYSGDGDLDLVLVSGSESEAEGRRLRVLENKEGGGFAGPALAIGVTENTRDLSATNYSKPDYFDFDQDGKIDVIYSGSGYGLAIAYNINTGNNHNPEFSIPVPLSLSASDIGNLDDGVPKVVDFDHDGTLDPNVDGILVGTQTDLLFLKYEGNESSGLPKFTQAVSILPSGFSGRDFIEPAIGDVDNNGTLDVVVVSGSGYGTEDGKVLLLSNGLTNGFALQPSVVIPVSGAPTYSLYRFPELVDFDGDGDLDILSGQNDGFSSSHGMGRDIATGSVRFLENIGVGSFSLIDRGTISSLSGEEIRVGDDGAARVIDFNKDGRLDILISDVASKITPFLNIGSTPGIETESASPVLKVTAVLPSLVQASNDLKELRISFPMMIHVGGYLDINDLYVSGHRVAMLNQEVIYDDDIDDDGLPDDWERLHFGGINVSSGGQSSDGDWLTDLEEYELGLDPNFNDDVDGDGWIDGQEARWLGLVSGLPTMPSQLVPWADSDGDGLADGLESSLDISFGANPFSADRPEDVRLDPVIRLFPAEYDASSSSAVWINRGRIGETFVSGASKAVATTKNGKPAVEFISGQANRMVGPRVPSWMNGAGSRTVAAWVFNPSGGTTDDDVIVSWGSLSLGAPQPTLFSTRFGPNATKGALSQSGNGSLDRGWGSYQPTTGTWSFVVHRYDSKSGSLVAMRDFQAGFLNTGLYLETGIFGGGVPHCFVLGGDNDGNGGQDATVKTGLAFGDVWVWDRSVPLSEIISTAYEPLRASYGKSSSLADADGDGVPDVLESSLGWNPANANTDGDGSPTGGGNDLAEFEQGTDPLDFHNGLPHQVIVSGGNHQTIDSGTSTTAIRFRVSDLEGNVIPGSPLEITVPAGSTTLGKVRLASAGEATLGSAIAPVPVTDSAGEVSIIFKAN